MRRRKVLNFHLQVITLLDLCCFVGVNLTLVVSRLKEYLTVTSTAMASSSGLEWDYYELEGSLPEPLLVTEAELKLDPGGQAPDQPAQKSNPWLGQILSAGSLSSTSLWSSRQLSGHTLIPPQGMRKGGRPWKRAGRERGEAEERMKEVRESLLLNTSCTQTPRTNKTLGWGGYH